MTILCPLYFMAFISQHIVCDVIFTLILFHIFSRFIVALAPRLFVNNVFRTMAGIQMPIEEFLGGV